MYVVPYVHLSEVSSHCLSVHYTPSIATQPATYGRNVWQLIIVRTKCSYRYQTLFGVEVTWVFQRIRFGDTLSLIRAPVAPTKRYWILSEEVSAALISLFNAV